MFIYVHLPFCLSRCIYCDFYVELKATSERKKRYLQALKTEIAQAFNQNPQCVAPIKTLYLGGGTPGLFTAAELAEIWQALTQFTHFTADAEITLEANPDGLADAPQAYLDLGINRLSVGVQSLQKNELKRLSRIHSVEQVYRFLQQVRLAGFHNISIDLMYGIPEQTAESWQDTVKQVIEIAPQHISMYGLKVEPQTKLEQLIIENRMALPPDDDTVAFYEEAIASFTQSGYNPYEMSNLALPGYASRHNQAYWQNKPFWGFGVSAHGYINGIRYENSRHGHTYLTSPCQHAVEHVCTLQEQWENAFIFGLRQQTGVHVPTLEAQYGFNFTDCYTKSLQPFFDAGWLMLQPDGWLKLTPQGIPVSNTVLSEFLLGHP